MSREEVLRLLVEHIEEWDRYKLLDFLLYKPAFVNDEDDVESVSNMNDFTITKQDWLGAKAAKEKKMKSDFSNAPEGATHISSEDLYYRLDSNSKWYFYCKRSWTESVNGEEWLSKNLTRLPVAQPEKYTPKVGEECEYMVDEGLWIPCFYVGVNSEGKRVIERGNGDIEVLLTGSFRPLRTQEEVERNNLIALGCSAAYGSFNSECTEEKNCASIAEAFIDAGWRPTK